MLGFILAEAANWIATSRTVNRETGVSGVPIWRLPENLSTITVLWYWEVQVAPSIESPLCWEMLIADGKIVQSGLVCPLSNLDA